MLDRIMGARMPLLLGTASSEENKIQVIVAKEARNAVRDAQLRRRIEKGGRRSAAWFPCYCIFACVFLPSSLLLLQGDCVHILSELDGVEEDGGTALSGPSRRVRALSILLVWATKHLGCGFPDLYSSPELPHP